MHKTAILTASIICCGLIGLMYNKDVAVQLFSRDNISIVESNASTYLKDNSFNKIYVDDIHSQSNIFKYEAESHNSPLVVNYSLLPDDPQTNQTKEFLNSIHSLGKVGKNDTFQKNIQSLNTLQVLANMMLRKDEAYYINTASISPNMLTEQQLRSGVERSLIMIKELKMMQKKCRCSTEQKEVINIAAGRLMHINHILQDELMTLSSTDTQ